MMHNDEAMFATFWICIAAIFVVGSIADCAENVLVAKHRAPVEVEEVAE